MRFLIYLPEASSIVFAEVLTCDLETGYDTAKGATQLIVCCGQNGRIFSEIGVISPMATCGAPLASPSVFMILKMTSERYPGQARCARTEGHSLDGAWENAPDMEHATNIVIASACILDGAFLCRDESLCDRLTWSASCRGVCRNLECTRVFRAW